MNHSFAAAAGGVISTANDLATWIQALVSGRVLNATINAAGSTACSPKTRTSPTATVRVRHRQTALGTEHDLLSRRRDPGFNSFMGYDPGNQVTLVVWTNLTVSLDENPTANALMLKVLDQIYVVSPLPPSQAVKREK